VGFVVLGQVLSPSTSVSPANLHSTIFSTNTITYHPGLVQQASSGRSTQSPTAQIKKIQVFSSWMMMILLHLIVTHILGIDVLLFFSHVFIIFSDKKLDFNYKL
jgi:hypothetical protein